MNEEELFCKLFPEYVVNGKPLSPYFDLFESGYEQSEKRIAELEQENERLSGDLELWESGACRATNLDKCGVVQELKEQLTKAEEFLKDITSSYGSTEVSEAQMCLKIKKAEIFLKELENGKEKRT